MPGSEQNALIRFGIHFCYHVTPLHYLPYLVHDKELLCKSILRRRGFPDFHFRSTTHRTDVRRGFADVVHCSTSPKPAILLSKLKRGYPHVVLAVPLQHVRESEYFLCRYNIARNRGRFTCSESTGQCYEPFQLPVAFTPAEKEAMLREFGDRSLEVLFRCSCRLPSGTRVHVFDKWGMNIARSVLGSASGWDLILEPLPFCSYPKSPEYREKVLDFIERAIKDPTWCGFPLEFDR